MSRRALAAALSGAGLLAAVAPGAAQAVWEAPQLASVDTARLEQADGAATGVDVSGDGRWVVFATRATNFFGDDDADAPGTMRRGGIFRFDRATGALALVADGDLVDDETGELLRRGAASPSVSDDGRRVAFASAQRLAPQDGNDNIDVYVRDMAVPLGPDRAASGAYALVSARDGGEEPARYEPLEQAPPGGSPGASVLTGQSLSADGRYVAFRTAGLASDLPALDGLDAPPGSVFVRDLQTRRTVLASPRLDGAGSAGGALAPVVLSRDGSTVAWVGENVPAQTRMLAGESVDPTQRAYLWRRWDEPGAATRRITGLADPDDPACPAGQGVLVDPTATGPCFGPLTDMEGAVGDISGRPPALSGDGWTVAYLTAAALRPASADDGYLDVFLTSMRPGASRKAATRVVTKGTTAANQRANGDVESVALSADASRLVVVTTRREFLPPAPALAGDARPSPPIQSELYAIDLGDGARIRRPLVPLGGEIDGSVDADPALAADGRTIAFVTRASNLVAGDANQQPDAFAVTEREDRQTGPPPAGLGEDPIDLDLGSDADLAARASARRDGSLLLRVTAPEPGALRAVASTRPVRGTRARRGARRTAARPARRVASATGRARRAGTVRLVLRLRGRDRRAVRGGTPLAVRVAVTLTPSAAGSRARRVTVAGTFRVARRAAPRRPAPRRRHR